MRNLSRIDPFVEFRRMLAGYPFDDTWFSNSAFEGNVLPLDIREEENQLVVEVDLPGFESDDVEVTATSDSLTIKAEHLVDETSGDKQNYVRRERRVFNSVARTVNLPSQINTETVDATFKDGKLTVVLPKSEAIKPKKVSVKVS